MAFLNYIRDERRAAFERTTMHIMNRLLAVDGDLGRSKSGKQLAQNPISMLVWNVPARKDGGTLAIFGLRRLKQVMTRAGAAMS